MSHIKLSKDDLLMFRLVNLFREVNNTINDEFSGRTCKENHIIIDNKINEVEQLLKDVIREKVKI